MIITYPSPDQMVVTYTGTVEVPLIVLQTHDTDTGLFYTTAGTGDTDLPVGTVINPVGTLVDVVDVNLNQQSEGTDYGYADVGGVSYVVNNETWDFTLGGPVDITNQVIDDQVSIDFRFGGQSGWFPIGSDPVNSDGIYANFDGGIVYLPDGGSTALLLGFALAVLLSASFYRSRVALT